MLSKKLKTVCNSLLFASICFGTSPAFSVEDNSEKILNYYAQFAGDECQKKIDSWGTPDFWECASLVVDASTQELERTFKEVLAYIDSQDPEYSADDKKELKSMLMKSQSHWEKHRELEISIATGLMKGATGSGPSNVMNSMTMQKNFERVKELRASYGLDAK